MNDILPAPRERVVFSSSPHHAILSHLHLLFMLFFLHLMPGNSMVEHNNKKESSCFYHSWSPSNNILFLLSKLKNSFLTRATIQASIFQSYNVIFISIFSVGRKPRLYYLYPIYLLSFMEIAFSQTTLIY